MSTNPFRRDNTKTFNTSTSSTNVIAASDDVADPRTLDLSVNTRVPPGSTDRHVSFASPPVDTTIPAVSYPSSPESTRISPAFQFSKPALAAPTDYSAAIQSDPFRAEDLKDEGDEVLGQALTNAQTNVTITEFAKPKPHEDAVKNTLSRFASAPHRTSGAEGKSSETQNNEGSSRQAMDVDAFKRLLLTGDSGQSTPKGAVSHNANQSLTGTNDSSSSADTASLSQHSLFDSAAVTEDTPRSSHELDITDAAALRENAREGFTESRKKAVPPPTPTPRRGKSVKKSQADSKSEAVALKTAEPIQRPTNTTTSGLDDSIRRPPTPPMTRRQSNKAGVSRPEAQRSTPSTEPETDSISYISGSHLPPPPPSRRRESDSGRRSSMDLAPTVEEPESPENAVQPSRKAFAGRPPPPPSRNSSNAKRSSLGMMYPPPVPPPRRGRGSSRSSIDSHRPAMSVIMGGGDSTRSSGEYIRSDEASSRVPGSSQANTILADLAALQREVDEARQRGK